MVDHGRVQRLLACLGEPSRFRVLCVLVEGDRCVTEVADRVGLSQSCTTRHLQALLREGVVNRVRRGKRVIFQIADSDPDVVRILEGALLRTGVALRDERSGRPGPPLGTDDGDGAMERGTDIGANVPAPSMAAPIAEAAGADVLPDDERQLQADRDELEDYLL